MQAGSWLTDERMRMLTAGLLPASAGPEEAQYRAVGILGQQVRAQAYTMAIADGFILIGWMVVAYLLLMLLPAARQAQLQGLEEHAMNRKAFFRTPGNSRACRHRCGILKNAADIRHLTLTEAVHLAISQNRALKIARLR